MGELTVELRTPGGVFSETRVQANGHFYFNSVPAGHYSVRIRDVAGTTLAEKTIAAESGSVELTVRVPVQSGLIPSPTAVSFAELSHRISPPALKEGRKADKALQKHDWTDVIAHLENAVKIDPEYVAAHRNLARAYLQAQQLEKAAEQFELALRLDSRAPQEYGGLAMAYLGLNRFDHAEAAARSALTIDSSNDIGHFVLGCSLAGQRKGDEEALQHLYKVADRFPKAHVVQAIILARRGQRLEARTQLQAYLESGDLEAVSEANDLLARL